MKYRKHNVARTLGTIALVTIVLLSGCAHPLTVKNLNSYSNLGMASLSKRLSIGVIPYNGDIHCEKIMKGIGDALGKYGSDVLLPYNLSSSRKVDIVANISVKPEYKGSLWNLLLNFPGFLIWAPALNGYVYKVNYNVDVLLTNPIDKTKIDSFNLPINLDVRHADINRTWAELSWFEVGSIALVSGIFYTGYDKTVSSLIADEMKMPIGDYIAQKIVSRINNSGKFAGIIRKIPELEHQMITSLK